MDRRGHLTELLLVNSIIHWLVQEKEKKSWLSNRVIRSSHIKLAKPDKI